MYSQWGQDDWVIEALGGLRGGYFVDIGAWNGVEISNTVALERHYGWTGLCVEPEPGAVDFVINHWSSAIDADYAIRETTANDRLVRIKVPALTMTELFEKHEVPARANYLSMDIDGGEPGVLATFDFSRWSFDALTVEHSAHLCNHPEYADFLRKRALIRELLESRGYAWVRQCEGDDCYLRR